MMMDSEGMNHVAILSESSSGTLKFSNPDESFEIKKSKKVASPHRDVTPPRREMPSPEEMQYVSEIRDENADIIATLKAPSYKPVTGDYKIARYLSAAGGDVQIAKKLYRKYLQTLHENDHLLERYRSEVKHMTADTFTTWWKERAHPFFPIIPQVGETADGDLLVWIRVGAFDAERVMSKRPKGDGYSFHKLEERLVLTLLEWLNCQVDSMTRQKSRFTYCIKLFDFKHPYDWKDIHPKPKFPLYYPAFNQFFRTIANYAAILYPETDSSIVIVNPGLGFKRFWTLGRKFATRRTLEKIRICKDTANQDELENNLYPYVPGHLLPKAWGGGGPGEDVLHEYRQSHGERLNRLQLYLDTIPDIVQPPIEIKTRRSSIHIEPITNDRRMVKRGLRSAQPNGNLPTSGLQRSHKPKRHLQGRNKGRSPRSRRKMVHSEEDVDVISALPSGATPIDPSIVPIAGTRSSSKRASQLNKNWVSSRRFSSHQSPKNKSSVTSENGGE